LRVITAGLKPADMVVVSGVDRAIPGRKVSPPALPLAATTDASDAASK
jgi:hypothetical protein